MSNKKMHAEKKVTDSPVGTTVQIGMVVAYMGKAVPEDWLLCDGSEIPSDYHDLIAMVGSRTPNFCARALVGTGTGKDSNGTEMKISLDESDGEFTHTLALDEIPSHQHFGFGDKYTSNWGTGNSIATGFTGAGAWDTDNYLLGSTFTGGTPGDTISTNNGSVTGKTAGATTAHSIMQPFYGVNYIIYAGTAESTDE